MAKVGINTGSADNAGDGSTLRAGANIINANFDELYDALGDGTTLSNEIVIDVNNNANNKVITGSATPGELNAESNLTFDGSDLYISDNIKHKNDTDTYIAFTNDQIELYAGGKGILTVKEDTVDTVIVNDGSNNCDFRVEGLNDNNLLISDGSSDRVGIGTAIPRAKLDISGDVYVGTSQATGVVLTSPDGTKYRLIVANGGALSTTAV